MIRAAPTVAVLGVLVLMLIAATFTTTSATSFAPSFLVLIVDMAVF